MSSFKNDVNDVKSDARDRLASDFDQLKSNFVQLKDDVGTILKNALGAGKSGVSGAKDQAGSTASAYYDQARGTASSYYDQAKGAYEDYRGRGQQQVENVGETITEHPLASAAIAFGVGFVLAKILTKR